ncbi:MAG TPA: thioesterase family protein [Actinomycetota bacterium]|nr:thioesterase family protein [Actinomycetota bacterium]
MSAPASLTIQRRIEWSDTDASGHWHNTAAFRMVEWAETALLERLGIVDDVYGHLPRVHVEADFHRLLGFRDLVDATIAVEEVGKTSLKYAFTLDRAGERCVTMKVVVALLDREGTPRPWPGDYRKVLLEAGPQPPEKLVFEPPPGNER